MLAATQGRRGAGENDCAALAWQHHPRGFAAGEEARQGGHFPDLAVHPFGGLGNRKAYVGADIEHHHFQWPDLPLDGGEQLQHLLFYPCIAAEGTCRAASGADVIHQAGQLVGITPCHAGHVALAGEAFGDCSTGGIASAHDQYRFTFSHHILLGSFLELG